MRQKSGFLTLILSLLIALSAPHNALAEEAKEPDYSILANRLCTTYNRSRALVSDSKSIIKDFVSKHENVANPTIEDMVYYLNLHKHEMICDNINYLSYAFERRAYNLIILDLFANQLYSDDILLDFNSITMTKNPETNQEEPMTVLDYIDKVALKTYTIAGDNTTKREIKEIRRMLIEDFGAKHFSELGEAEINEWYRASFDIFARHGYVTSELLAGRKWSLEGVLSDVYVSSLSAEKKKQLLAQMDAQFDRVYRARPVCPASVEDLGVLANHTGKIDYAINLVGCSHEKYQLTAEQQGVIESARKQPRPTLSRAGFAVECHAISKRTSAWNYSDHFNYRRYADSLCNE